MSDSSVSIDDVFAGIPDADQIKDAIKNRDVSYLRGVIQWYERKPANPYLVDFLKKVLPKLRQVE